MSIRKFFAKLIHAIVINIYIENNVLYIDAKLRKKDSLRCPKCRKKSPIHQKSKKVKTWYLENLFGLKIVIIYKPNRIKCPEHGTKTEWIPWARHKSKFARILEDKIAVLFKCVSKSFIQKLYEIKSFNTISNIIERSFLDNIPKNLSENKLIRIGIDETSYKKGHKYVTIVVNHDTGEIVWVGQGKGRTTLDEFFESIPPRHRRRIELVTADGAAWIAASVKKYCPNAILIMDSFHVMKWINDALNEIRINTWKRKTQILKEFKKDHYDEIKAGNTKILNKIGVMEDEIRTIKSSRYALLRNFEDLNEDEKSKVEIILETDSIELIEAWRIKENLHQLFTMDDSDIASLLLSDIICSARNSSNKRLNNIADKLDKRFDNIIASNIYGMNNGRIEGINTKIKFIIRKSFGFSKIDHLTQAVMLATHEIVDIGSILIFDTGNKFQPQKL